MELTKIQKELMADGLRRSRRKKRIRKEITPERYKELDDINRIKDLNAITLRGLLWDEESAKELINSKKIDTKTKNQIRKSITELVKKWTKILKVLV